MSPPYLICFKCSSCVSMSVPLSWHDRSGHNRGRGCHRNEQHKELTGRCGRHADWAWKDRVRCCDDRGNRTCRDWNGSRAKACWSSGGRAWQSCKMSSIVPRMEQDMQDVSQSQPILYIWHHLTIFDSYPESHPFFHVSFVIFVLVASEKEHWSEMANQRPRQQVSQPAEEPKCGPKQ